MLNVFMNTVTPQTRMPNLKAIVIKVQPLGSQCLVSHKANESLACKV